MVSVSSVQVAVTNIFDAVDRLTIVKMVPKMHDLSTRARASALSAATIIASRLPDGFSPVQLIDATFAILENLLPADVALLKWLNAVVDALFTATPSI